MKEYVCSVCGYVYQGNIPDDFVCPVCGAGRDAFHLKEEKSATAELKKTHVEQELSPMEMSIICSNLARGCEKQYMAEESAAFTALAEFFKSKAPFSQNGSHTDLLALIEKDLSEGYPYGNQEAKKASDRGAQRALVWNEKVTRMLDSLLKRYEQEGEKMLKNTGVYVCTICGFVYVGDTPPELCPVCKVPSWKFEKVERRAK